MPKKSVSSGPVFWTGYEPHYAKCGSRDSSYRFHRTPPARRCGKYHSTFRSVGGATADARDGQSAPRTRVFGVQSRAGCIARYPVSPRSGVPAGVIRGRLGASWTYSDPFPPVVLADQVAASSQLPRTDPIPAYLGFTHVPRRVLAVH